MYNEPFLQKKKKRFSFLLYARPSVKYILARYTLFPVKMEYMKVGVHESLMMMPKE